MMPVRILLVAWVLATAACTAHPWRNPQWSRDGCTGFSSETRRCHFYRAHGTAEPSLDDEYAVPLQDCFETMRRSRPEVTSSYEAWLKVDACMATKGWDFAGEVRAP